MHGTVRGIVLVTALLASCGGEAARPSDRVSTSTAADAVSAATTEEVAVSTSPAAPTSSEPPALHRQRFEYQPGLSLTLLELDSCGDVARPVMVALSESLAEEFARRGYVGVVVETRGSGASQFDARAVRAVQWAVHDMAIAVQWLRAHAVEHCVLTDAIAATGFSFGGISALTLAYSDGELRSGEALTIDELHATVTIVEPPFEPGPPELAPYSDDLDGVVAFAGFAIPDQVDGGDPPAILFNGRYDTTIPFALAEDTCAAALAAGIACVLVPQDTGHTLPPDLDDAVDQALRFLEREMLGPAELVDVR